MKNQSNGFKNFYFFIGTEAEFIKMFPVMIEFERRLIKYTLISSGQNNIQESQIFKFLKKKKPNVTLSNKHINPTATSLFFWFFQTLLKSIPRLKSTIGKGKGESILIVHGDTVSSVMGAILGKICGIDVAHVESGLRSYNYLSPFPEEIDRVITSHLANIKFSPNAWAAKNLGKGNIIDTKQNTLLDSTNLALRQDNKFLKLIPKDSEYFMFVMHRTENIYNEQASRFLILEIINASRKMKCLFIMHESTRIALDKWGLMKDINREKNIIITTRLSYIEMINALLRSEFIATDGGSNQEEAYYLGKPCLLLRSATERIEGLGENAVLSKNSKVIIESFFNNFANFKRAPITYSVSPSKIIVDYLTKS